MIKHGIGTAQYVRVFWVENMPAIEHLESNLWLFDGVVVNLYSISFVDDEKAHRSFWIGIDRGRLRHFDIDVVLVTKQLIAENADLGIQFYRVIDYVAPVFQFDSGVQHAGLFFTWEWTPTEHFAKQNQDYLLQRQLEEADERSLRSISSLIGLLKSNGVPLSEQPPNSPKHTWLNHFRPTVEHIQLST